MKGLIGRLEEYRLENRISQMELAEMLQVTHATVSRWLNGHTEPSKIQVYHIEKLLSVKGKRK
ncbi:MAG: helix-turn-helix transcriptional regulator [candidate division Zixibacteria bacterium]|nr:helix-turn-helix transcriptional regulator [candidate division Zixibacteria bacterium]MDH3938940.1 helix-turn-helix transcriptional regulator [candidate division Zixibacteria bacterium]MDH4032600.1 helix-turn-helix transcriptional regulator [candidate division Zixibacteria bacterium]